MARTPTAGQALRSLTLRLRADEHPYYLHRPRGPQEPAPGWYWRPAGAEHPVYLAANHLDAYVALTRRLEQLRHSDTGQRAGDERAA